MIRKCAWAGLVLSSSATVHAETTPFGNIDVVGNVNVGYSISELNNTGQHHLDEQGSILLGIRGARYVSESIEVSYIVEASTKLGDANDSGEVRQAWVGLRGAFGEVRAGRHLSPVRVTLEPIDLFTDQSADHSLILESDVRHDASIAYINRSNNIGYAIAASSSDDNDGMATEVLVNYATKPLYVAGGYLKGSDNRNTLRLGGTYRFEAGHQVGAAFEHLDDTAGNTGHQAYTLNAGYRVGKAMLKGQLGRNEPEGVGHAETLLGLGVDYELWDEMVLRAQYSINAHRDHSADDENRVFAVGVSYYF